MKIKKLIEIVDGKLINESDKDELFNATVVLKKVSEDDLFISSNMDEIQKAIELKASAILFDTDEDITCKSDVALIKVESIKEASLKLISYIVNSDKDLYFYLINPQTQTFLNMIQLKKESLEEIPDDWEEAFETILNSKKGIFISSNEELLKKIKPKIKKFIKSVHGYNVEDTLFRSTFKVEKFVYQHKQMAPFHISFLLEAVAMCKLHDINYSIERISYTKHFMPIFINEETYIQKGEIDDHVVIVSDNLEDIAEAREYAKMAKVTMSKSIVFTPPKVKVESYTNPTIFRDSVSLVTAVKTTSFNYGFVYTDKKEHLEALRDYFRQINQI